MMVEDLKEASKSNKPFSGTYVISRCELKPFKAKTGFFLQCDITDRTGTIRGIIWENAERLKEKVRNKAVVEIHGETTRYNDTPQAVIKIVKPVEIYDKGLLVPSLSQEELNDYDRYWKTLGEHVKDPFYQKIWSLLVFNEPETEIAGLFRECPGGIGDVHHAYLGGLTEHSYSMAWTALHYMLQPRTAKMDQDLLLTGCLVHDIGKIRAYNWDTVIEMSDEGRLLHHVPLGVSLMNELVWEKLYPTGEPEVYEKFMKLMHIIVSHHEIGDETGHRKPMLPEAMAVARLDALDAAVIHAIDFAGRPENHEEGTNWTKYCYLSGVRYFKPATEEAEK